MPGTSLQLQLGGKGESFTVVSSPRPTPGAHEVCIRSKAVGLNPIDWKNRDFGVTVQSWPTVLGSDVAGIVESVGESVTAFRPGDEVLSPTGGSLRGGGFQEIVTVSDVRVAKKPAILSFEEASSAPTAYTTACTAVHLGLKVPLTHVQPANSGSSTTAPLQSIFVLGGSSAVGAAAIQLLRHALPSATILTTSSAKHHDHLMSLGASKCFDRSDEQVAAKIKAASPNGAGIDAILDAVGGAADQLSLFTALKPDGPKLYSEVGTGAVVTVPEGVQHTMVFREQIFGAPGGANIMPALTQLIEAGKFKLPVKVEVVGKGLESISAGVDKLKKGVSGTKYVVSL